jgi:uncharacterized protein DUF5995
MPLTQSFPAEPQSIDQVIECLNGILDDALRRGGRIGYFTALYERVTSNVRRALVAGNVFEDNARMEHLDVVFATRYLQAWCRYSQGQSPLLSWQLAFDLLNDPGPLVIQHLLLGMNAHINLDLGVAAATIAPAPAELSLLWPDFKKINEVLSRLVGVVEVELGQISPRLNRVEEFAPTQEGRLFAFGIDAARDFAWALAEELIQAERTQWNTIISRRDATAALAGKALYPLQGFAGEIERWIHAEESSDVPHNIQIVAA